MALSRLHYRRTTRVFQTTPRAPISTREPLPSLIDEEQSPNYNPQNYYSAQVGESIGKYRILSKLGWGVSSTAWLAKDLSRWPWQKTRYVTLKITNCGEGERRAAEEELEISNKISSSWSRHKGRRYVRIVQDCFNIQGQLGPHVCLVLEPLREPIWRLGKHLGTIGVQPSIVKPFLRVFLEGLDFLHSECGIIHTDLKADNLLIAFEDPQVIEDYLEQQRIDPAPSVFRNGRHVCQSRSNFGPLRRGTGLLKISDFGAAVYGNTSQLHTHDIQPLQFSAPEVLLNAGWTYSADIWNLGTMLWELLAETTLFSGLCHPDAQYSKEVHMAQMIRLLGEPPSHFFESCDPSTRSSLFSQQGEFLHPHLIPSSDFNFETLVPFLSGEDKRLFIKFALRMLRWDPKSRPTAKELMDDPWLWS